MPTGTSATISGGSKWRGVLAKIAAQKCGVKAGILKDSRNHESRESIVEYAASNEFGTPRIPARPFLRTTVETCQKQWANDLKNAMAHRNDNAKEALTIIGDIMRADIIKTVENAEAWARPLAERTVVQKALRGRSDPTKILVDTGSMIKSIAYEVVE